VLDLRRPCSPAGMLSAPAVLDLRRPCSSTHLHQQGAHSTQVCQHILLGSKAGCAGPYTINLTGVCAKAWCSFSPEAATTRDTTPTAATPQKLALGGASLRSGSTVKARMHGRCVLGKGRERVQQARYPTNTHPNVLAVGCPLGCKNAISGCWYGRTCAGLARDSQERWQDTPQQRQWPCVRWSVRSHGEQGPNRTHCALWMMYPYYLRAIQHVLGTAHMCPSPCDCCSIPGPAEPDPAQSNCPWHRDQVDVASPPSSTPWLCAWTLKQ
jgi:hypothetical protein